ncbi:ubiquitin C-terminal hydrolase 13-like [Humulus lupulus]|uniref:ubiquitin C-terminal hydrolase 13-like n=1 Tax=Humulus lupulus TaxID=3486 RepID=UPI002B40F3B6|nr:ubiquitin C-terminal hydrolase 13-like [Humulus lupulus]
MDTEISRSTRRVPPAHYLLKVQSYSLLSNSSNGKYDSSPFEAGGYKWRLSFYPNGDKRFNTNNDHISLYLTICETGFLSSEVNVIFILFVYNHMHGNYLTVQAMRRFHEMKKEWGFEQLESLKNFKDLSKGYLFNDSCVFGAEVFVINQTTPNSESLSVFKDEEISNPTYRWEIKELSKMDKSYYYSQEFSSGGAKWYLWIYPEGSGNRNGKSFSMYLMLADGSALSNSIYAECCLRVIDQVNSKHRERSVDYWFSRGGSGRGYGNFMLIEDLYKSSNGYVVKDTLILEVEFLVISQTETSAKPLEFKTAKTK